MAVYAIDSIRLIESLPKGAACQDFLPNLFSYGSGEYFMYYEDEKKTRENLQQFQYKYVRN